MYLVSVDKHGPNNKIGEQFTEIFIKNSDSVGLVLTLLEEFEFKVRWPALRLLMYLSSNRLKDIQEIILVSPMGVSKLMDLLGDTREVIRNDVHFDEFAIETLSLYFCWLAVLVKKHVVALQVLLLLIQLTKGNANIQKIVAFENAFDRIFDVIAQEGNAEGGIVVEDCLLLMLNLLRGNISNQNFFKEGKLTIFERNERTNERNKLTTALPRRRELHSKIDTNVPNTIGDRRESS